ncbi:MAG: 50S ribosomal protein L13 [Candidatus Marinimicrobia bacterium]|nr:50S ribosomal protein L13 [Candidatus Neomarinimicrobiota bacterium]
MFKTYFPKKNDVQEKWHIVDADGVVLGRLASQVAAVLRGKNNPLFTPYHDMKEFVIIVNAEKVRLTGKKSEIKTYFSHSGYLGHEKTTSLRELLEKHPERIIEKSVKGMLPKNSLGREMFRKLRVYAGPEHPHKAQQPVELKVEG